MIKPREVVCECGSKIQYISSRDHVKCLKCDRDVPVIPFTEEEMKAFEAMYSEEMSGGDGTDI